MYLRYFLDNEGKRVYTFKFHDQEQNPTLSAHPGTSTFCILLIFERLARFSPDDVYQKERMKCKERFKLLPTQKPAVQLWIHTPF